jgi:hypothetical protein
LGEQYFTLEKKAIEETMIHWEGWGQKMKYKNLPSHFDGFLS